MKKQTIVLSLVSLAIISTGCSNKKCVGENSHDGLYNALTCNYEENIEVLELSLNEKVLERNKLFHNYQRLISQTTNKQHIITKLNQEISSITGNITSIQNLIKNAETSKASALTILRLKTELKKLNMDILNKSTFFDVEDALFSNQKLLVNTDTLQYAEGYKTNLLKDEKYKESYNKDLLKNKRYKEAYHQNLLQNKKYAQAYHQNLLSNQKYAQAYKESPTTAFTQAYKKDIAQDKILRESLSKQIEKVQQTLTSTNNALPNSKKQLNDLIKNIKLYTDTLTAS